MPNLTCVGKYTIPDNDKALQITIPRLWRDMYKLKPGDKLGLFQRPDGDPNPGFEINIIKADEEE